MSTSSFLALPAELRDEIYKLCLGQRTVHVRSQTFERFEFSASQNESSETLHRIYPYDNFRFQQCAPDFESRHELIFTDALSFDQCREPIGEHLAYELAQKTRLDDPFGIRPVGKQSSNFCRYCKRHSGCRLNLGRAFDIDVPSFAMLLVCKQIHREVEPVIFNTTTFSFELAFTLDRFVHALTPRRTRYINTITLDIMEGCEVAPIWDSDNLNKSLRLLVNLQTLHLRIIQPGLECPHALRIYTYRPRPTYGQYATMLKNGTSLRWSDDLVHVCHPSLRDVTVVIEDNSTYGRGDREEHQLRELGHWTMAERAEFARLIRAKILAP